MDHRKRDINFKRTVGRKAKPNFGKDMWGDIHFCLAQILAQMIPKATRVSKNGKHAGFVKWSYYGTVLQLRRELIRLLNVIDHYIEKEKDFISWR